MFAKCKKFCNLTFTVVWFRCKIFQFTSTFSHFTPVACAGFKDRESSIGFEKRLQNSYCCVLFPISQSSPINTVAARSIFPPSSPPRCSALSQSIPCKRDSSISDKYGVDDRRSTLKVIGRFYPLLPRDSTRNRFPLLLGRLKSSSPSQSNLCSLREKLGGKLGFSL